MDNVLVVVGTRTWARPGSAPRSSPRSNTRRLPSTPLASAITPTGFDLAAEQRLLCAHERVVLLFPLYWYSCPALLKRWIDEVFTPGFAYARGGDKLKDKEFLIVTSVGAPASGYRAGGFNRYTLDELLRPLQQTVAYVKGRYLPPLPVFESVFIAGEALEQAAAQIAQRIVSAHESPDQAYENLLLKAEQASIALLQ
ncbi:NAD(P)H-dependent oxidoreductase [Pseudomonas sp. MAFF212428]|uniref:NAD(P)H-dependent oxidoreductase n=1 Tax=Pseudomonas brassicae TaxID=2708063 RepID=A0A6M0CUS2_9PSED|nr:NAD(P)H-dependent oxidoreductase [Pseudomonas brassicae]